MELRLGFCGIVKLSTQIILQNLKHFLCIALALALPFALSLIVLAPIFCHSLPPLVACISLLYKLTASPLPLPPSDLTAYKDAIFTQQQHPQPPPSLSPLISLFIFSILISLICCPLVAFSVCRACINKSLDLKGSLRGVLRSAMNLALTVLCVIAAFLAFCALAMLVMVIVATVLSAVDANLAIPMTIWTMGVVGGVLYMAAAWSLADAVAILEEKKGWEAMRRSVHLMKGSKGIAMGLYCLYGALCAMVPLLVCVSKEACVVWRWSAGGASVGLQGFIALCGMAAHVVLYMACRSHREEPLDTVIAASSQFGPRLEYLAKYLNPELAALTMATL